jgi:hypothetical protein
MTMVGTGTTGVYALPAIRPRPPRLRNLSSVPEIRHAF